MTTMLLGRPLTFGDTEQINEIRKQEVLHFIKKDSEIKSIRADISDKEDEIHELEGEIEDLTQDAETRLKELIKENPSMKIVPYKEALDTLHRFL